jgi:hypothetical protein
MNVRVSRYCKSTPGNKHIVRLTKRSRKEFGTETKNRREEWPGDTLSRELTKMSQLSSIKSRSNYISHSTQIKTTVLRETTQLSSGKESKV